MRCQAKHNDPLTTHTKIVELGPMIAASKGMVNTEGGIYVGNTATTQNGPLPNPLFSIRTKARADAARTSSYKSHARHAGVSGRDVRHSIAERLNAKAGSPQIQREPVMSNQMTELTADELEDVSGGEFLTFELTPLGGTRRIWGFGPWRGSLESHDGSMRSGRMAKEDLSRRQMLGITAGGVALASAAHAANKTGAAKAGRRAVPQGLRLGRGDGQLSGRGGRDRGRQGAVGVGRLL